jgi:hypothetical protein
MRYFGLSTPPFEKGLQRRIRQTVLPKAIKGL